MNVVIPITTAVAVPFMTSLELVDFINEQRKPGEPVLRHDNFMAKVPQVLGEGGVLKFKDTHIRRVLGVEGA